MKFCTKTTSKCWVPSSWSLFLSIFYKPYPTNIHLLRLSIYRQAQLKGNRVLGSWGKNQGKRKSNPQGCFPHLKLLSVIQNQKTREAKRKESTNSSKSWMATSCHLAKQEAHCSILNHRMQHWEQFIKSTLWEIILMQFYYKNYLAKSFFLVIKCYS